MSLPPLRLKKNEHRRLRAGHPWVYSNQVDTDRTPLGVFQAGELVCVETSNGRVMGTAYINPRCLICARLLSRDPCVQLNRSLLVHRLNVALSLRARLYEEPCYRLVFGESDALPGLVVDRYGDTLVVQIGTAGMERVRDAIVEALLQVLAPRTIILRNDTAVRELEALPRYVDCVHGEAPGYVEIREGPARFLVSPVHGQKTGWYYDQRDNRRRLSTLARQIRVLDAFCYTGAWGVLAAMAGARHVCCLDSSASALQQVGEHAELNGVADRLRTLRGDAFEVLAELRRDGQRFDVVVLDPPALIRRKRDLKVGTIGYRRLNQMAMELLERDGILVSASCSFHLRRDRLQEIIWQGARHRNRIVQILHHGAQGPDHPVHPALPETGYLKTIFSRVLPG